MKLNADQKRYFVECLYPILQTDESKSLKQYVQHGTISTYDHCISVAYYSYWFCCHFHLRVHTESLIRGAYLHDFYLYDWHDKDSHRSGHGFHHPKTAYRNADRLFDINKTEKRIILSHMWPLTLRAIPCCKEAVIVCLFDKICSTIETCKRR